MSFTFTFFTKPPIHYSLYNNNNNNDDNTHSSNPFNTNPNFNPFFHYKPSTRSLNRVNSLPQKYPFHNPLERTHHYIALFSFSSILLCLRLLSNVLLPNFPHRWRELVAFSKEVEAKTTAYPSHLWRAVVAYEDVRFFTHFGVDPVGVSRAVLSLSARGGGSTITQQLVKNTFLRCERTFSRKIAEMVLALALERVMSKRRILGCYMSKIYWGHGVYGIESASNFYFGKHPSLLNLGEAALLAGIIPAPEIRSPFMDSGRGKVFQARVLKRMVKVGFIDTETALVALKQSLHLCAHGPDDEDGLLRALSLSKKELAESRETKCSNVKSSLKDRWDWEKESKVWEVCEDMERWATTVHYETARKNYDSYDKMHFLSQIFNLYYTLRRL